MKNSVMKLEAFKDFGVEEISLKNMEDIYGGEDPFHAAGVATGKAIYHAGKAVYNGAKNIYNGFAQIYNAYF
jgi:hypothetical protein